jgi:hypothetical protein
MSKKKQKRKSPRRERNMIVLHMINTRKGGPMKDKREPRGGTKNHERDLLNDEDVE